MIKVAGHLALGCRNLIGSRLLTGFRAIMVLVMRTDHLLAELLFAEGGLLLAAWLLLQLVLRVVVFKLGRVTVCNSGLRRNLI